VTQLGSARSPAKAADRFLKIRTTNDDDRIRLGTRFDADAIRHMGGTMSEQLPPAKDRIDVVETQARRRLSIEKT
jgi:hypothetical protein